MTAISLTPSESALAQTVAREMGRAFGDARRSHGDTKKAAAELLNMNATTVQNFERAASHNVKLGNALRILRLYNLTLAVVPLTVMRKL